MKFISLITLGFLLTACEDSKVFLPTPTVPDTSTPSPVTADPSTPNCDFKIRVSSGNFSRFAFLIIIDKNSPREQQSSGGPVDVYFGSPIEYLFTGKELSEIQITRPDTTAGGMIVEILKDNISIGSWLVAPNNGTTNGNLRLLVDTDMVSRCF